MRLCPIALMTGGERCLMSGLCLLETVIGDCRKGEGTEAALHVPFVDQGEAPQTDEQAEPETAASEVPASGRSTIDTVKSYIQVLRLNHWHKNVFTVLGALACIAFLKINVTAKILGYMILGTFISCLISSVNYAINEFLDAAFDAEHPVKQHRPVPSGRIHTQSLFLLGGLLLVVALGLAAIFFNKAFVIALLLFLMFGLFYNVEPIRAKEIPFVDVICESVNNPLRLAIGWFSVTSTMQFPPVSLALLFWVFGAFLMTSKRLAEFRYLGDTANKYRATFHHYTERSLLAAMIGYSVSSFVFLAWQVCIYGALLAYTLPLLTIFTIWWFKLTYEPDSVVKEPERVFTKPFFFVLLPVSLLVLFLIVVSHRH